MPAPPMKAPTNFGDDLAMHTASADVWPTRAANGSAPPRAMGSQDPASAMGKPEEDGDLPAYLNKVADTSWGAPQPWLDAVAPSAPKRAPCSGADSHPKRILKASPCGALPSFLQKDMGELPAFLREGMGAPEEATESMDATCHLDFKDDDGSARKRRVRFGPDKLRRGWPAVDHQMIEAQASMAAARAARGTARSTPRKPPAPPPAFEDAILSEILKDMAMDFSSYAKNTPHDEWDRIEEKEEANAWRHAADLAAVLPEDVVVRLLGGAAAAAQVPGAETRASILVSALKSRGGPSGAGSRLALTAWNALVHLTPSGVPTLPASAAFVASCKRAVDAAAREKGKHRKQGGATAVSSFEAGLFALASKEKGLGMDISILGIVVVNAVEKFIPQHRDQAATAPIAQMVAACRAARAELPAYVARKGEVASTALKQHRLYRLQASLRRHAARVVVLAWVFGLRFKHMQRFRPSIDEVDPENVIAGRASLAKDGEPLDVFAPAMDLLGKFTWYPEFVEEFETFGGHCFPGFKAVNKHRGDPAYARWLTGGFATDESSRMGLYQSMGISAEMMKDLGVSWHSLHGSLADDGSVLATVPIKGYVFTHDMLRCLGWWQRNSRQNIDVAAAASASGTIADRSRDFSLSVGLPSTLSEMLVRYTSGVGRNGVRARAISARTAVIAALAKGVSMIGEHRIATGSRGILQIQDRLRDVLTAQRPP